MKVIACYWCRVARSDVSECDGLPMCDDCQSLWDVIRANQVVVARMMMVAASSQKLGEMVMTDSGHGWVRRNPGGHKASCGGPPLCADCQRDLERFAAEQPARDGEVAVPLAQLQRQFNQASA